MDRRSRAGIRPGRIPEPRSPWWTPRRLERIAEHLDQLSDLKRVYVTRHNDDLAHPRVQRLEEVIGLVNDWDKLPDLALPDVVVDPEDDATIFSTLKAATGKPKGALDTHRNVATNHVLCNAISSDAHVHVWPVSRLPIRSPQ